MWRFKMASAAAKSGRSAESLDGQLRALLDKDIAENKLVTSRAGMIHRAHYANRLGLHRAVVGRLFADLFGEYEKSLEVRTGPMARFDEMRAWLETAYNNGTLEVRGGKADRSAFSKFFGLNVSTASLRYEEIGLLFRDLDERIQREDYLPANTREKIKQLERILADPLLHKNRKSISRKWLRDTLDVRDNQLDEEPFASLIANRQAQIILDMADKKADPLIHGRIFAFSPLVSVWGRRFVDAVGISFKQEYSTTSVSTAKDVYLALLNFLKWCGNASDRNCQAVVESATKFGYVRDRDAWEEAVYLYRQYKVSDLSNITGLTLDGHIKSFRSALTSLHNRGVVPDLSLSLKGVKNARRRGGHLRSVAEATFDSSKDYISFAQERYAAALSFSGDEGAEAHAFLASLGVEIASSKNLPDDPAVAIRNLLENRIDVIQRGARKIIEDAQSSYRRGQQLMSDVATIDVAAFVESYFSSGPQTVRRALLRKHFPIEGERDLAQANLLVLWRDYFSGIPQPAASHPRFGQFLAKRYLELGGLDRLAAMIMPSSDAVGAALTLYLCESGANVGVARTLAVDCVENSDLPDHVRVTGEKVRAAGKPIIYDIHADSPAIQAMKWLRDAGQSSRSQSTSDQNSLFTLRIGDRVQLATSHWYTAWFKEFIGSLPELKGVQLLPSMIRPSVLLHASLSNDGRLATGMALGQHKEGVSQGYQQKYPTRLLYDAQIRKFQDAFETIVLANMRDVALRLGLSDDELERRLEMIRPTGLGTFCSSGGGRDDQAGACTTLDCWNDCPHLLIVAEVEAIAALQLWQKSLREAQADWERDRPERWEQVWLPWLCLADVVEEKLVRGSGVGTWRAASDRATEISSTPGYVPPRPW